MLGDIPIDVPPQPKYWRGCVPGIPGGVDASGLARVTAHGITKDEPLSLYIDYRIETRAVPNTLVLDKILDRVLEQ